MSNSISRTAIDEHVWRITRYLWERYGVDAGNRMISPLNWYISTGRAINLLTFPPLLEILKSLLTS